MDATAPRDSTGVPSSTTVGVVGAGITGLVLARELDRRGVAAHVFESSPRPGGVIHTREREGRVLDLGPQRTRLSDGVRELVERLGLEDRLVTADADGLLVYHDGRLRRAPLSPRAALGTDLLSLRGKCRLLVEPLTGPPREGESVAAFFERTCGSEAARRLLGPLYAGLYGSDPAEMPVEHSLGKALSKVGIGRSLLVGGARKLLSMRLRGRERPPAVTFQGGMSTLPEALYAAHADRVSLSTPVERVERRGDRYRLRTPAGAVTVEEVVLTTPAPVTADLLEQVAPAAATILDRLRYNPLGVVHVEVDPDREAMGFLVSTATDTPLLGATYNCVAFDREDVVTCYLGGSDHPGLIEADESTLARRASEELERITGLDATPLAAHRWRRGMPAYDRSWKGLSELELPAGIGLCANYHARAGIPGRIRAARERARLLADRTPKLQA